jgi:hypothetical protein
MIERWLFLVYQIPSAAPYAVVMVEFERDGHFGAAVDTVATVNVGSVGKDFSK